MKKTIDFAHSQSALSVDKLSDGKILVFCDVRYEEDEEGGHRYFVARFNSDGSQEQMTELIFEPNIYAIQNDGKIVAPNSSEDAALSRFNIDGSLDNSFANVEMLPSEPLALAIQSDGKIVVAGFGYISRYNADGSFDLTFGDNGMITDFNYNPGSIFFGGDGKIVVSLKGSVNERNVDIGLVRFNSDGSPDNTFSGDSKLMYNTALDSTYYTGTAIQSNGKIAIAGYAIKGSVSDIALARYHVDGSHRVQFGFTNYTRSAIHQMEK
ncbi:MAG: hypothetical protein WKG06_02765 [Segetibacter sp.]